MSNPFDFFGYKACINLPEATDRWVLCEKEFAKVAITGQVEQIFATPPPVGIEVPNLAFSRGNVGANLSHAKALFHAISSGADAALIFEDDFYVTPKCEHLLRSAIADLPSDWDILYLGGNPTGPMTRVTPNLLQSSTMMGAFSYAVSKKFMLPLLDRTFDFIIDRPFDTILSSFGKTHKIYVVDEPACRTRPGVSGVRGAYRSYEGIITNNWKAHKPS